MAVRFCRECGNPIEENDKFCYHCGTRVHSIPQPEVPVAPAAEAYIPPVPEVPVVIEEPVAPLPAEPEISVLPEVPVYTQPPEPSYREPSYIPPVYTPPVYAAPEPPSVYPPVPPAPAPETSAKPQKVKKEKPQKSQKLSNPRALPKRSGGNVFCCVLICILIFLLMLPTVLLVNVRMAAEEAHVLSTLQRIQLNEMPAKDVFVDIDDDRSMLDWACQYLNKYIGSEVSHWDGLEPKALSTLLESTTLTELLAETISGLMTDVIDGTILASLEASDIEAFLEDNSRILEKKLDAVLSDDDRAEIAAQVMELLGNDKLSLKSLPLSTRRSLEVVTTALSVVTLALLGILIVLLIALLFVANRKYIMAGIHDTGVVLVVLGALMLVLTGVGRLLSILGAGSNAALYAIGIGVGFALEGALLVHACIFAFGILLLLISGITCAILKKKAAN